MFIRHKINRRKWVFRLETLKIIETLETIPKENIYTNEPMKNHTSFKIGGPAEIFIKTDKVEQIQEILSIPARH